jgi:hypothetical protein
MGYRLQLVAQSVGVSSSVKKQTREETPQVETNEQRKKAVRAAIQEEREGFFAQMQDLSEGDLEQLEEQVVQTSQQMGRR